MVVWVEPPLARQSPLLIGCRLFNGHPRQSRTLLQNEVKRWPGSGNVPLRFTAAEPISSYELCVWDEESGRLLAQQDEWVLRRINAELAIADPSRFVSTEWDRSLPDRLRRMVVEETGVTHEPLIIGDYRADPWVAAEDNKRVLMHQLGTEIGASRFFPAGDEHHVVAMLFLARLMNLKGIQKVLLADPYLDESAVNALLVRVRDVPEVVLLSSHDQPQPAEQENWWKGSLGWTALYGLGFAVDWCQRKQSPPATVEPTVALVAACDEHVGALPTKVSVINVRSAEGKGNQFHDRNIIVEFKNGAREVWNLTNSLSMVARRFPLSITLSDRCVGQAVADHLTQLQSGNVPGKPNLQSDVLWEKPTRTLPLAAAPPVRFQGEDSILQVLAPDVEPGHRLTQALNRGLLEPEVGPERTTWRVPPTANVEVAAKGAAAVRSAGDNAVDMLRVLGEWEYFGGLNERDYGFGSAAVPIAEVAIRAILSSADSRDISGPLDLSSPARFPECFSDVRHYVYANAPGDIEPRGAPGLSFIADILWRLAPESLVAIAGETGGSKIPVWLATNAGVNSVQGQVLLRSGQPRMIALGITLIWDQSWPATTPLADRIAKIETEMSTAGIEAFDRFLAALALCVLGSRSRTDLQLAFSVCVGLAPTELDDAAHKRLIEVLSPPGQLHRIVRVSALGGMIPTLAVAGRLHGWVIERTLQNLHFRGTPIPVWDSHSPAWDNPEVLAAFANSYWCQHGSQASERFVTDVLMRLNFRAVDAPLFRTRDYGSWCAQVTGLLWGLLLGVALVKGAPTEDRPAALASIRRELIRCLGQFRPCLWNNYGDFHGLLASVVTTISAWVDDAAADVDRTTWENLFLQPIVPEIWKMYAMLNSSRLTERHIRDLDAWAQDPASSASLCDLARVTKTRSAMLAAVHDRKTSIPTLVNELGAIESRFLAWWDVRY